MYKVYVPMRRSFPFLRRSPNRLACGGGGLFNGCMEQPDTLLMDLGNVMIRVEPGLTRQALEALGVETAGIDEGEFYRVCFEYESGGMDSQRFLDALGRLTGVASHGKLRDAWNAMFPRNGLIAETVQGCKRLRERGVRVVAFSNTNAIHIDYVTASYPELVMLFDETVYSYLTKGAKPGPAMYREAVERIGLVPGRTLYFDDRPENIEAGLAHGFRSVLYDYRQEGSFWANLPEPWRS